VSKQKEYEIPEARQNEFDLRVHMRDPKGRLLKVQPYSLHVKEGVRYFERPVGSHNLFFENNEPAGRLVIDDKGKRTVEKGAPHQEWNPPQSASDKLYSDYKKATSELEAARAELEAIRKEAKYKEVEKKATKPEEKK